MTKDEEPMRGKEGASQVVPGPYVGTKAMAKEQESSDKVEKSCEIFFLLLSLWTCDHSHLGLVSGRQRVHKNV